MLLRPRASLRNLARAVTRSSRSFSLSGSRAAGVFAACLLLLLFLLCALVFAAFDTPPSRVRSAPLTSTGEALASASLSPEKLELHRRLRLHEVVVESLQWEPRIFRLHNLLTAEECDELIKMAKPALEASTVVDTATGAGILSQVRTSQGMFITDSTPTTQIIRARISHLVHLPEENQEAISILRYEVGQFYRPHQDFFGDQQNINRGGQRTATVLMYLTDVEAGGETIFPNPRKGDAVLFYTMTPVGKEDSKSIHGSCEVVVGEKWSATTWIRTGKFT